MKRLVRALYWAILGIGIGAVEGAAIGWLLNWGISSGALLGATAAGGVGFIAGLFRHRSNSRISRLRYNLEQCAWCNGSGVERKAQRPCSVCGGQGRVLTPQPSPRCPKCKGKGRLLFGRRCTVCYGAGWDRYGYFDGAVAHR